MNWTKRILPHGPIEKLADGLWQVTGSLPRMALPRNMLIYRMPDGDLWLHSAIALKESAMLELEKLGKPAVLVVPNRMHRMDAPAYKRRYPSLRVLCPRDARAHVETKVAIDGAVEDELPKLGIEVLLAQGTKAAERAYRLPVAGGAVAFCDLVFNIPHQPGFGGKILRWLGSSGYFGVTKIGRRFFVEDATVLANWFDSVAATGPEIVTVGHGSAVVSGGAARLREAAMRLREGA